LKKYRWSSDLGGWHPCRGAEYLGGYFPVVNPLPPPDPPATRCVASGVNQCARSGEKENVLGPTEAFSHDQQFVSRLLTNHWRSIFPEPGFSLGPREGRYGRIEAQTSGSVSRVPQGDAVVTCHRTIHVLHVHSAKSYRQKALPDNLKDDGTSMRRIHPDNFYPNTDIAWHYPVRHSFGYR
jgi:hypothetical protein